MHTIRSYAVPILSGMALALLLAACAGSAISTPQASPTPLPPPTDTAAPTLEPTPADTAIPTIPPTFTPDPAILFNVPGDSPVLRGGKRYTDPGGVVYHDGQFHMFSNTFTNWPGNTNEIHYYTSADGFSWERQTDDPLPIFQDDSYMGLGVMATHALVEDDGTWVLYFYTMESGGQPFLSRSGRATAPAPLGPWTADPAPLLDPGPEGAWDDRQAQVMSVVKAPDGKYYLYYSGTPLSGPPQIGLATSDDGLTFAKYDDPATTDALYAASDPIFKPEPGGWDGRQAHQPRVLITPDDGWVMLYRSNGNDQASRNRNQYGLAFSDDGLTWTRHPDNPIHEPQMFERGHSLWFNALLYVEGVYYLFFELSTDNVRTTQIYTGAHAGPLR